MTTPIRSIRINEDLWLKLKEQAEKEESTASEIIVKFVKEYTK